MALTYVEGCMLSVRVVQGRNGQGGGTSEYDMWGKEEELLIFVVCLSKYRLEPTARAVPGHKTPVLRQPSATDLETFRFLSKLLSDSLHLRM
jgi:hypothetical protein